MDAACQKRESYQVSPAIRNVNPNSSVAEVSASEVSGELQGSADPLLGGSHAEAALEATRYSCWAFQPIMLAFSLT